MSQLSAQKKDQPIKDISKFKFKEPKLRETILDKSLRCMTLNFKKQNIIKEFLVDEIQSIDLCVEKLFEFKRQLKVERQEFFRRPLTQARIKEKRKNDEHYDDFIKEYEEQESKLKDYELVYYDINDKNFKQNKFATITASSISANANTTTSSSKIIGIEKDKSNLEKKKEKKNMQMYGKLIQKEPVFRMYRTKMADDGMFIDEELEAPSFKYKYLTKDQILQKKIDNLPKKHNIPEKYCMCCNQLVRRHYCPHDYCEKPCIRNEKEMRLRQQYLDKNGGVRKQKKPLYKASVLAGDISQAKSALDETMTIEQQQEAERIKQMRIQAILQQQKQQELKNQQLKQQNSDSQLPKKKGRKSKFQIANSAGGITTPSNNNMIKVEPESYQGDMSLEYNDQKNLNSSVHQQSNMNSTQYGMDIEKSNAFELNNQLDQILNRRGSVNSANPYDNKEKNDSADYNIKNESSFHDEEQLLQQLVAQENVQNLLGSKIIYRNEDNSYESSSSGISSDSSDDEDKIKIDED